MKIYTRAQIEDCVSLPAVIETIEQGFAAYSNGNAVIPPVAALHFDSPPGDCHIKYGYARDSKYYVIKIASGFQDNSKLGLPTGNGLMLLCDKQTGGLVSILLDEGYLTDLRTAAAGSIAAKYLGPKNVSCIGIVGTGAQAYYQLKLLQFATPSREVLVWGRDQAKAQKFRENPLLQEWNIHIANNLDQLTDTCNLIVTTTSSKRPLLYSHQIHPGTHITAIGADDIGKQELEPEIFAKANRVVVDSRSQCAKLGDASYALNRGIISQDKLIELGDIIMDGSLSRNTEKEITVADLTGVAIQDLQIATYIYETLA